MNIDHVFDYHPPTDAQVAKISAMREAAKVFARAIEANTPMCADQTAALRKVREALFTANAAVVLDGKL
jgi:predicted ABC-type ATPase